jgi:hypothetical protein
MECHVLMAADSIAESSSSFAKPTRRELWIGCVVFALIGVLAMIYLHGPGLLSGSRYHGDLTQAPHWVAYHGESFAEDDLLLEYATFNETTVQNAIYWVGTWFMDVVLLNKIVGIAIFSLTAALFFGVVSSLAGLRTGILAACFFVIFPRSAYEIAGGFSKAWSIGLILVVLYLVEVRAWRMLVWIMPLAALAYPMAPVLMGAVVLVSVVMEFSRAPGEAVRGFKYLCVGSALALVPLLYKYFTPPGRIGEMISTSEMRQVWEAGINRTETWPLWKETASYLEYPFYIYSAVLLLMLLFRRGLVWKRSWSALVIASSAFYVIADMIPPKLYLPDRYVRYSVAVLLVLWFAYNWARVLDEIKAVWWHRAAMLLLVLFAVSSFSHSFKPCDGDRALGIWEDRDYMQATASAVARLPDPVLIAGHPYNTADIVVQARKPVLVIHRMSHPWFADYAQTIDNRNRDYFRAVYARDPAVVNLLAERYGVTHLVVKKNEFDRTRIQEGKMYRPQYTDLIRQVGLAQGRPVLFPPPRKAVVFEDSDTWLIQLPLELPTANR